MKLKPFARWFPDPVYRVTFFVVCCRSEAFMATLTKLVALTDHPRKPAFLRAVSGSYDDAMEGCNGRCFRIDGPKSAAVIWIQPGVDVSVLVHELWHALFWIFQHRGVRFDAGEGADEPVAYYLQSLMRRALNWSMS